MILPSFIGRVAYVVGYPLIKRWLSGSTRVYAVIRVDDEILVTKNWLGMHKQWRLPGGGVEPSENVMQALVRELQEELNLTLVTKQFSSMLNQPQTTPQGYKYYLFSVFLSKKPRLDINKKELIATEWISLQDIRSKPITTEVSKAIESLGK